VKAAAYAAIVLAQSHVSEGPMPSSAKLCVDDAVDLYNAGAFDAAHKRAVRSLHYSCGVFSPAVQSVEAAS
jgi:hypothetical protein